MSILGDVFGTKKNHTTTSNTSWDEGWDPIEQQVQGGVSKGFGWLSNPTSPVAGWNQDNLAAFQGVRDTYGVEADNRYSPYAQSFLEQHGGTNYADAFAGLQGRAGAAIPVAAQYATTGVDDIMALANPYAGVMSDIVVDGINDGRTRAQNQNAATAARRNAFGGSGEALARANIDADANQQIADSLGQIAYDAYGQGANIAQGNTAAANNSIMNTVNAIQNSANYDLGALSQADGATNNFFNRYMSGLNTGSSIFGDEQTRLLAQAGMLGSVGDQVKAQDQALLDQDYTTLQRVAGFYPGASQTTTTSQPVYNDPIGKVLGYGMMANMAGFL